MRPHDVQPLVEPAFASVEHARREFVRVTGRIRRLSDNRRNHKIDLAPREPAANPAETVRHRIGIAAVAVLVVLRVALVVRARTLPVVVSAPGVYRLRYRPLELALARLSFCERPLHRLAYGLVERRVVFRPRPRERLSPRLVALHDVEAADGVLYLPQPLAAVVEYRAPRCVQERLAILCGHDVAEAHDLREVREVVLVRLRVEVVVEPAEVFEFRHYRPQRVGVHSLPRRELADDVVLVCQVAVLRSGHPFEEGVAQGEDVASPPRVRVVPVHPKVVPGARLFVLDYLHIATSPR